VWYRDLMIVNDAGEACFKIVAFGTTDPLELLTALHASARAELRSELTVQGDPNWTSSTFELSFAGLQSKGRPVRAHLFAHRGHGFLAAASAELKAAFADADALIVRAGPDVTDDINRCATLLTSAGLGAGVVVVLEAPTGGPDLAAEAAARFAPRPSYVLTGTVTPLEVLKLAVKGMLTREARRPE